MSFVVRPNPRNTSLLQLNPGSQTVNLAPTGSSVVIGNSQSGSAQVLTINGTSAFDNVEVSGTTELQTVDITGNMTSGSVTSGSVTTANIQGTSGYNTYQTLGTEKIVNPPSNNLTLGGVNISALNKRTRPCQSSTTDTVTTWISRTVDSASSNRWSGVCWSSELGIFCAIASNSSQQKSAMTSPDGITWTAHDVGNTEEWYRICWSPELRLFCTVLYDDNGSDETVMTSPDGVNWTLRSAGGDWWSSVCWSPELGLFCAVSDFGPGDRVMTSPDSINWTYRTAPSESWFSVCWAAELGLFCAVAYNSTDQPVMTSPDGITWTSRSALDDVWESVCWAPELSLFCAVSYKNTNNSVITSPDGITWTARSTGINNRWESVCWAPELSMFCAVSRTGSIDGRIMTSFDGINWAVRPSVGDNQWFSVCWSPELSIFCAVAEASSNGGTKIMTSNIGIPSTKNVLKAFNNQLSITNSGDLSVTNSIVGTSGYNTYQTLGTEERVNPPSGSALVGGVNVSVLNKRTRTSQAAAETAVTSWTNRSSVGADWTAICWSPELSLFCAVRRTGTGDRVGTSPDGITWTLRTSAADSSWSSICWAAELGIFCAVSLSNANNVMTSPDGINWTLRATTTDNDWNSICWSPELSIFVVVTNNANVVETSPDGINWTLYSLSGNSRWKSVCWAPELGILCAVGDFGTNRSMISSDGINWVSNNSIGTVPWEKVVWAAELGIFCAVTASGGANVISRDGVTWTRYDNLTSDSWHALCWSPQLSLFCTARNQDFGVSMATSPDGINWTQRSSPANYWYGICWSPELSIFCACGNSSAGSKFITSTIGVPNSQSVVKALPTQVTVTNSGNMGINTTTPSEKLHVIGNILASGTITPFTGAHITPSRYTQEDIGKIVSSNGHIQDIQINNAWPQTVLSSKSNDPGVYGVVSEIKENPDSSALVNAVGEGAVWVCDIAGPLSNGDLITTSVVTGYGQKQAEPSIYNYTAARAIMDCNFDPQATKSSFYNKKTVVHHSIKITDDDHKNSLVVNLPADTKYKVQYVPSGETYDVKVYDADGKPIFTDEQELDADGNPKTQTVTRVEQVHQTDPESGELLYTYTPVVNRRGQPVTEEIPKRDPETGEILCESVPKLDSEGAPIYEKIHLQDEEGNFLYESGHLQDEEGNFLYESEPLLDADGAAVTERTPAVDAQGNFVFKSEHLRDANNDLLFDSVLLKDSSGKVVTTSETSGKGDKIEVPVYTLTARMGRVQVYEEVPVYNKIPIYGDVPVYRSRQVFEDIPLTEIVPKVTKAPVLVETEVTREEPVFVQKVAQVDIYDQFLIYDEIKSKWEVELDADGNPVKIPAYTTRYIDSKGSTITQAEYTSLKSQNESCHVAALIGCIYLCG